VSADSSADQATLRFVDVDGGGHLFLLEQPAEMAALVTGFLTTGR
jgi:hypothetical protein